jgi:mono/diheme cytochrome c family protein
MAMMHCVAGNALSAQDPPLKNPLEGNAGAIEVGMGLFRSRCAGCHGMGAQSVRAPDLTAVWASGRTDDGLFKTIKGGVPGTEMPAIRLVDTEVW